MLRKVIKFTDCDGNEREGAFFFNLNKAELMEMEMGITGGMKQMLEKIVSERDTAKIIATFKDIILRSYGERAADGIHFDKIRDGHRLADAFAQTDAYSELFMELATDDKAASAFINGIIPQSLAAEVAENSRRQGVAAVT